MASSYPFVGSPYVLVLDAIIIESGEELGYSPNSVSGSVERAAWPSIFEVITRPKEKGVKIRPLHFFGRN